MTVRDTLRGGFPVAASRYRGALIQPACMGGRLELDVQAIADESADSCDPSNGHAHDRTAGAAGLSVETGALPQPTATCLLPEHGSSFTSETCLSVAAIRLAVPDLAADGHNLDG